jgi:hypothetical protein
VADSTGRRRPFLLSAAALALRTFAYVAIAAAGDGLALFVLALVLSLCLSVLARTTTLASRSQPSSGPGWSTAHAIRGSRPRGPVGLRAYLTGADVLIDGGPVAKFAGERPKA